MLWGFFWRRFAFISCTCLCPLPGRNHFNYTFALSFSHHEMYHPIQQKCMSLALFVKYLRRLFLSLFCNSPWTVEVAGDVFINHLPLCAMLKFIYLVVLYLSRKYTIKSLLLGGLLPFLSFFLCLLWYSKKKDHNVLKLNMLVKCFEINSWLISLASFLYFIYIYIYIYNISYSYMSHIYSY